MTTGRPKLNNRGFSLIELLVGVAILVVVLGPLLYAFITSQRVSSRSHTLGEATLVARNIVETVRTKGVNSTLANVESGFTGGTATFFGPTAAVTAFDDSTDGIYEFTLTGVLAGEIGADFGGTGAATATNDTRLDAIVTIDARRYRSGYSGAPYIDGYNFNDLEITEYLPMDGIHFQPLGVNDPDEKAIQDFIENDEFELALIEYYTDLNIAAGMDPLDAAAQAVMDYEDNAYDIVRPRMKRDIIIDVDFNPPPANEVMVNITYQYRMEYDGISLTYEDAFYNIYGDPVKTPLSVYFFYRPHYKTMGSLSNSDDIWIHNYDMVDINIFLIKQKPVDAAADPGAFAFNEAAYRSFIVNREDIAITSGAWILAHTKVYTNVRNDLSGNGAAPGSRFTRQLRRPLSASPDILYSTYPSSEFNEDLLVSKINRDRMYDIFINVYSAGDAGGEILISYDATHLD